MDTLADLARMLLVAGGIGLVIFVHELGHFLAARWCKVRVEVFSLGFGPRLWSLVHGATTYQLALVPLGGFVRMAGEEGRPEGSLPAPDDLWAKSIGQRFFIYSGGVLMNLVFGLVVFPILFAHGVPFTEPLLGEAAPGGPAWHARLQAGSRVLEVNDQRVFEFNHIPTQVALGNPERTLIKLVPSAGGPPQEVALVPRMEPGQLFYSIEVNSPLDPAGRLHVETGGPAERAGLREGDRLLGVVGAPAEFTALDQLSWAAQLGRPVDLRVASVPSGDGENAERVVAVAPEPQADPGGPRLGISPPRNHVFDLRDNPWLRELDLHIDDRLVLVQGVPVRRSYDLECALLCEAGPVELLVSRSGRELTLRSAPMARERVVELCSDIALRADIESTEVLVMPGEAAAKAGLRDGDRIQRIDEKPVANWKDVQGLVARAGKEERALRIDFQRSLPALAPSLVTLEVVPQSVPTLSYGFAPLSAEYVYRASSPIDALQAGALCSWRFVQDSWLTVKRMLLGQVSSKNLGGIITIGRASYSWAEAGLAKLFFFLCILSINLAFLNVLPIPILDGGHLLFLLIEKIKGSPVSERVYGYSQMVGLVLIISLMVYVTYNDLMRLFET